MAAPTAPAASDDSKAQQGVRFHKRPPEAGDSSIVESVLEVGLAMSITARGAVIGQVEGTRIEAERRREEVLGAVDGTVTKVRVQYLEKLEIADELGERTRKTSPLSGHEYVVERTPDGLVVARSDGESMTDEEIVLVKRENRRLGEPNRFAAFVPERPVVPGERLVPPRSVVTEMFGAGGSDVKVQGAVFRFRGADGAGAARAGTFDVEMDVVLEGEPPMRMRVRGHLTLLLATSAPTEMFLEGPIVIDARSASSGAHYLGNGKTRIARKASYPTTP